MSLLNYINEKKRTCLLPFMGTNGLFLTGYTIYEVYNSPEKQLEIAKKMDEYFPSDFIYPMDDGNIFCEILNIPMKTPDYDFPSVKEHPVKSLDILKEYKVPDPYKDGRMPINLKSLKLISSNFKKPLFVSLQGPFTLACQMAGISRIAKSLIKEPDFVEKILEFTTEVVLNYAKAIEGQGVKYISIAEPSSGMISPKTFSKFIYSKLKYIYDNLNCWKGIHICGKTYHLVDQLITIGAEGISFDQIMDLSELAKSFPKDKVIVGNIDPIQVLKAMRPQRVEQETKKLINSMKSYDNFLLAFGCTCLNDTPVENIKAVISALK